MANLKAFTMPKWGIEMSEGTIAEWMVTEGAPFTRGQVLTSIETDKITNEVEAESDGFFVRLIGEAGEVYPVGALLAVLGDAGTDAGEVDAFIRSFKPVNAAFGESDDDAVSTTVEPIAEVAADTAKISPAAHAAAVAAGLNPASIEGSGRDGRVSLQDVHQAIQRLTPQ